MSDDTINEKNDKLVKISDTDSEKIRQVFFRTSLFVATTILGQGVNIGISSVIVATTFIGAKLQISKRDFWNICGRAGRAFVDGKGKILFAMDMIRKPWQVKKDEKAAMSYFDMALLDEVENGLPEKPVLAHARPTLFRSTGLFLVDFLKRLSYI